MVVKKCCILPLTHGECTPSPKPSPWSTCFIPTEKIQTMNYKCTWIFEPPTSDCWGYQWKRSWPLLSGGSHLLCYFCSRGCKHVGSKTAARVMVQMRRQSIRLLSILKNSGEPLGTTTTWWKEKERAVLKRILDKRLGGGVVVVMVKFWEHKSAS